MGLMETQIEATLLLQQSEETLRSIVLGIVEEYARTPLEGATLFANLASIISTAKSVGRVEYIHENCLKDGQPNKEKEG